MSISYVARRHGLSPSWSVLSFFDDVSITVLAAARLGSFRTWQLGSVAPLPMVSCHDDLTAIDLTG
jgi:hypothetical protein